MNKKHDEIVKNIQNDHKNAIDELNKRHAHLQSQHSDDLKKYEETKKLEVEQVEARLK